MLEVLKAKSEDRSVGTMRINSNDKINFNASLLVSGKKILKKSQITELSNMVKNVGTEQDCFFVYTGGLYKIKNNLHRNTYVTHQFDIPEIPTTTNVTANYVNNKEVLLKPFEKIKEHISSIIEKI